MNIQLEDFCSKRTAILTSTLELVKEHGFHGTPMSQIAKTANVAAGTIYHYFDSKETLMVELYMYTKHRLGKAMLAGDDESRPYKERFFQYMTNQYNFYIENESSLFFLEQYINSPFAKNYPEKDSDIFKTDIIPFFDFGLENGYFKKIDPRLMWPIIRGTLVAAAHFRISQHVMYSEEDISQLVKMIWDAIKNNNTTP
ncbi:TetR/AcrR family transcriptional regulator [Pedobacter metabolipauper]|uniref:TetR family transcriptional regulator n=1 Tax=Pedobacter metabolipauper TaxID=425513 RepID=A0A4R6SXW1_9SPHI|nr:TetR/AcrR family transcriptional regulator [Pedobacter metabolipauper]TDQ10306.1 TetR family transcriptional regulator [Pedobacter metabolipauper]